MDDIYSDLENYNEVNLVEELRNENTELKLKLEEYSSTMFQLQKDFDKLNDEYKKLELNYSSLLKTAKAEIERKSRMITQLNLEKDSLVIKAMQSTGRILRCHINYDNYKSADSKSTSASYSNKGKANGNADNEKGSDTEMVLRKRNQSESLSLADSCSGVSTAKTESTENIGDSKYRNTIKENNKELPIIKPGSPSNLSDRRKSMPAVRNDFNFSSDEEEKVDKLPRDEYNDKTHHNSRDKRNIEGAYESRKRRLEELAQYHEVSKDSKKHDRFRDSRDKCRLERHHRHSPKRERHKLSRVTKSSHSSRSDTRSQRILQSPPGNKYNRSKSRDYRYTERCDTKDFESYKHHTTHKLTDAEEPTHKRRKTESRSGEINDEQMHTYDQKNMILEEQSYMRTSCQSPDHDYFDNSNQHKIKEIIHTAATKLEDPRITSKKYIINKQDGKSSLIRTDVGNVTIIPVNKSIWGIEKVNVTKALKSMPVRGDKEMWDSKKSDLDTTLEPGEIPTGDDCDLSPISYSSLIYQEEGSCKNSLLLPYGKDGNTRKVSEVIQKHCNTTTKVSEKSKSKLSENNKDYTIKNVPENVLTNSKVISEHENYNPTKVCDNIQMQTIKSLPSRYKIPKVKKDDCKESEIKLLNNKPLTREKNENRREKPVEITNVKKILVQPEKDEAVREDKPSKCGEFETGINKGEITTITGVSLDLAENEVICGHKQSNNEKNITKINKSDTIANRKYDTLVDLDSKIRHMNDEKMDYGTENSPEIPNLVDFSSNVSHNEIVYEHKHSKDNKNYTKMDVSFDGKNITSTSLNEVSHDRPKSEKRNIRTDTPHEITNIPNAILLAEKEIVHKEKSSNSENDETKIDKPHKNIDGKDIASAFPGKEVNEHSTSDMIDKKTEKMHEITNLKEAASVCTENEHQNSKEGNIASTFPGKEVNEHSTSDMIDKKTEKMHEMTNLKEAASVCTENEHQNSKEGNIASTFPGKEVNEHSTSDMIDKKTEKMHEMTNLKETASVCTENEHQNSKEAKYDIRINKLHETTNQINVTLACSRNELNKSKIFPIENSINILSAPNSLNNASNKTDESIENTSVILKNINYDSNFFAAKNNVARDLELSDEASDVADFNIDVEPNKINNDLMQNSHPGHNEINALQNVEAKEEKKDIDNDKRTTLLIKNDQTKSPSSCKRRKKEPAKERRKHKSKKDIRKDTEPKNTLLNTGNNTLQSCKDTKLKGDKKDVKPKNLLEIKNSSDKICKSTAFYKSKFTELFGDSSSLITPDDLGIPVAQPIIEKYSSVLENTQDAVDLNLEEIKQLHPNLSTNIDKETENPVSKEKNNFDVTVSDNVSLPISSKTSNEIENKEKTANNLYINLNAEHSTDNSVKTIIISTGVQPTYLMDCTDLKGQPISDATNNANQANVAKNNVLESLKAVATSTPNKLTDQPESNYSSGENVFRVTMSSDLSQESTKEKDEPDMKIFVKRKRKFKKPSWV